MTTDAQKIIFRENAHTRNIESLVDAIKYKDQHSFQVYLTNYVMEGNKVEGLPQYDSSKSFEENMNIISDSFYKASQGSPFSPYFKKFAETLRN